MIPITVKPERNKNMYIEDLNLTGRALNALHRENIYTVDELKSAIDSNKIFKIRNIGQKAIKEIFMKLDITIGSNYFTSLEKLYNVVWYNPDAQEDQIIYVKAKDEREATMIALLIMNKINQHGRFTIDNISNIYEVDENYYISFDEAIKKYKIDLNYAAKVVETVNKHYKKLEEEDE